MTQKEQAKLEVMMAHIIDMKEDISELKSRLYSPDDGAISRANRNTSFRKEAEPLVREIPELIKFKNTVYKFLWIIISAVVALGVGVVSMHP